ncbi:MAG: cupredoxin domain-containing protein [Polaromonas sp.]|nr:cupredoxin domain-containing protein [Gemmatimonadaceae bacterium]
MQMPDFLVIAAGLAGIAWVNWYFFLAERGAARAAPAAGSPGGRQEVAIIVHGGYSPAVIRTAVGQPVRLVFDRQETSSCSEEVVFPDFGVKRFLPANEKTVIEITPPAAGTYEFMCGMGMLHGRVIAE